MEGEPLFGYVSIAQIAVAFVVITAIIGAKRYNYLSPQWIAYTGLSEAQQPGLGWLEQAHPEDRQRVTESWKTSVAAGKNYIKEAADLEEIIRSLCQKYFSLYNRYVSHQPM